MLKLLKYKKSQTPIEFMLILGIIFFLMFLISLHRLSDAKQLYSQKETSLVADLALKLQEEIKIAGLVEEGYSRNFTLPSKLENFDYTITIDKGILSVESKNSLYTAKIPNITGNVNKGNNIIRNSGGVLYINQ